MLTLCGATFRQISDQGWHSGPAMLDKHVLLDRHFLVTIRYLTMYLPSSTLQTIGIGMRDYVVEMCL
jgi:hypothetical protein